MGEKRATVKNVGEGASLGTRAAYKAQGQNHTCQAQGLKPPCLCTKSVAKIRFPGLSRSPNLISGFARMEPKEFSRYNLIWSSLVPPLWLNLVEGIGACRPS